MIMHKQREVYSDYGRYRNIQPYVDTNAQSDLSRVLLETWDIQTPST